MSKASNILVSLSGKKSTIASIIGMLIAYAVSPDVQLITGSQATLIGGIATILFGAASMQTKKAYEKLNG